MSQAAPNTSMSIHSRRWPRGPALAAAAVVVVAVALRLIPGPQICDDAYITFKYVRNLTSGLGFTYNPGERVLGTTTPLYTLLLSGLYLLLGRLGASIITVSWALNAVLDGASAFLLIRLCRRVTGSRIVGLLCGGLWALSNVSIAVSISGMETPLYVLLILTTLLLFLSGRFLAAALACSLVVLTRPDGLLLALSLLGYLALRERRRLLGPLSAGAAALVPWLAFALLYFGSPVATSVAAKNVVYRTPPWEAVRHFAHHWTTLIGLELHGVPAYIFAVPLTGLWLWGLALVRRRGRAAPVAIFPVLYLVAFAIANKPMFRWYFVPLEPFYLLGLGAALHSLVMHRVTRTTGRLARALAAVALAAVMCAQLLSLNLLPDPDRPWLTPKRVSIARETAYARVAEEINRTFPVGLHTTIATPEIGAFGYHSRARILDTTGLVSPEAIGYYPIDPALCPGNYAIAPDLILDLRPEMVISLENFVRDGLLKDERFRASYTEAMSPYPTEAFGSRLLLLAFRRRDWPPGRRPLAEPGQPSPGSRASPGTRPSRARAAVE